MQQPVGFGNAAPPAVTRVRLTLSSGSVVLGTGVVSVTLLLAGQQPISRLLMVVTALAWVAYAVVVGVPMVCDRDRGGSFSRRAHRRRGDGGARRSAASITRGWTWVALAVWMVVTAGMARRCLLTQSCVRHTSRR